MVRVRNVKEEKQYRIEQQQIRLAKFKKEEDEMSKIIALPETEASKTALFNSLTNQQRIDIQAGKTITTLPNQRWNQYKTKGGTLSKKQFLYHSTHFLKNVPWYRNGMNVGALVPEFIAQSAWVPAELGGQLGLAWAKALAKQRAGASLAIVDAAKYEALGLSKAEAKQQASKRAAAMISKKKEDAYWENLASIYEATQALEREEMTIVNKELTNAESGALTLEQAKEKLPYYKSQLAKVKGKLSKKGYERLITNAEFIINDSERIAKELEANRAVAAARTQALKDAEAKRIYNLPENVAKRENERLALENEQIFKNMEEQKVA